MQDDKQQMPRWRPSESPQQPDSQQMRPRGHATSRRAGGRGGAVIALLALMVIALVVLLTIVVSSVVMPILTQDFVTAPPATAAWFATQDVALTPTSADWYTFQNWEGGFQVDIPGVIGSSHAYFINDFSGKGSDFYYTNDPISSPLQQREAKIWVKVLYSTKITDENICPQGGTLVMLGSGNEQVPAWVRNEGRIVAVNLVLNGMAIEILLDTRDNAQPALPLYGDIWRHMLASFAPLPGQSQRATHPCG
jgi:hypothetical protein